MSRPVYLHGPPEASQTNSINRPFNRGRSAFEKRALMRSSLATRDRNSPTTAVIASLRPRRSKSVAGPATGAAIALFSAAAVGEGTAFDGSTGGAPAPV